MDEKEFVRQLTNAVKDSHKTHGRGVAAPDWSRWLQILMTIIQVLGPLLNPTPPGPNVP